MVPDSAATATAIFAGAKTEELYQTEIIKKIIIKDIFARAKYFK